MALQLELCNDADMPRYFEIVADAFSSLHEYINIVFPGHETPEGRAIGAQRFLGIKRADPLSTFLKVTDPATGDILGVAKWIVFDGNVPPEGGVGTTEFWDSPKMAAYADALHREYLVDRREAIRAAKGHLVSLDMLCVDPKHQYRGAGRMLVEWGTKKADELNVETVVEGSVFARRLYEQYGFKLVKHTLMAQIPGWEHRPRQRYFWMVRPKANLD